MTTKTEIIATLVALAEGRIDPALWDEWWGTNGAGLLDLLNPGQALRFRRAARPNLSSIQRTAQCQSQALDLLQSWGVSATLDPTYGQLARGELLNDVKEAQEAMRRTNTARRVGIARFDQRFPEFAAFLRRRASELDDLGQPATAEEIAEADARIGGPLPLSLREFLLCARSVRIGDVIQFDINSISTINFDRLPPVERPAVHGMMLLCEFSFQADGDQLVFDQNARVGGECPIFYYAHAYRPPRVTCVATTFAELLEWWAKGSKAWTRTLTS